MTETITFVLTIFGLALLAAFIIFGIVYAANFLAIAIGQMKKKAEIKGRYDAQLYEARQANAFVEKKWDLDRRARALPPAEAEIVIEPLDGSGWRQE